jgi:glyoxalase family protein
VLFEMATPSPGFAVDEDPAELGQGLKLPSQFEPYREQIAERLTPLRRPEHQVVAAAATEEDGR